jgi:competence protein ComEC
LAIQQLPIVDFATPMNHRNTPYLRLIMPFLLGTALGGWLDELPPGLFWLLAASLLSTLFFAIRRYQYRHRWVFGANLYACLFLAGYFLIVNHHELRQPGHFSQIAGTNRYLVCTVYAAPSHGTKTKIPVRVEAIGPSPDSLRQVTGNLLLFLDPSAATDNIHYGDRLGIYSTVHPTTPPKNPFAFDYQRYLHFQNIHFQSFVKPDSLLLVSSGHGNRLWAGAYACRDHLLLLLQQHFPTQDEYAVASALLLGYQDDLSDELRTAYAETGSMHALAVSGSHVGMLYIGLLFLTQRLRLRGRWRLLETLIILLAIWGFTLLTGATASVLRASVMFTTYLLGKAFWRNASAWNVLPASAAGLLLYNPYFLFDAGFQLSYAAVAGMVFFYPRLYKLFPPGPRWVDEGLKVLLVGMAAQLGTLPLSLYYFHQFPVYFWLAGWLVVLGGAIFLWGGAVLVLLDALSKTLAGWLGSGLYFMLLALNKAIMMIQNLPGSVIANVWIPGWVVLMLYGCIGLLGALMIRRRGRWLVAFLGVMALLGAFRIFSLSQKQSQRTMVVYNIPKQRRLIDFFDGRHQFALSDTLTSKQEDFAAKSNRIASGIQESTMIMFADTLAFSSDNLLIDKPLLQFFHQKIALIDSPQWLASADSQRVHVDALLLSKNPALTIAECQKKFPFRIVVFDASNAFRTVERWRQECEANGWAYHDVRTQGAWISKQALIIQ